MNLLEHTNWGEGMTQEERWMKKYEVVMAYIETNHRNPSKHRIEEHDMLNWMKANRKVMNAGKLKPERGNYGSRFTVNG